MLKLFLTDRLVREREIHTTAFLRPEAPLNGIQSPLIEDGLAQR